MKLTDNPLNLPQQNFNLMKKGHYCNKGYYRVMVFKKFPNWSTKYMESWRYKKSDTCCTTSCPRFQSPIKKKHADFTGRRKNELYFSVVFYEDFVHAHFNIVFFIPSWVPNFMCIC